MSGGEGGRVGRVVEERFDEKSAKTALCGFGGSFREFLPAGDGWWWRGL
jgi:hypothetical protein